MKSLKKYLLANSVFSALSGLTLLIFSNTISDLFNINTPFLFYVIGANLIAFALFVNYVAQKKITTKGFVNTIIALDTLWVLASAIIVGGQFFKISFKGYAIIVSIGVIVAFLGLKQYKHRNI